MGPLIWGSLRQVSGSEKQSEETPTIADAADLKIAINGLRWDDRLAQARCRQAESVRRVDPTAESDAQRWHQAVDPDDAGLFDRRLAWDGLDDTVVPMLLTLADDAAIGVPTWWQTLVDLRQACAAGSDSSLADQDCDPDRNRSVPFAHVLWPMVMCSWRRMCETTDPGALRQLTPTAERDLQEGLLRRLADVCAPAFAADFNADRTAGQSLLLSMQGAQDNEPASRARYTRWCRRNLQDGLGRLLGAYPVLGRLIAIVCQQWQRAVSLMLEHVHSDRSQLAETFGVEIAAVIAGVRWGLSDPHRGGRTVAVLTFESPGTQPNTSSGRTPLVYKPKDVRIEAHFQDLVQLANSWTDDGEWASVTVLPRDDEHGYTSFIEQRPCVGQAELTAFYRNAGRLLALLHLVGATDCHFENLIACGPSLHLIDAETLFQSHESASADTVGIPDRVDPTRLLEGSVLRTGLLPGWMRAGQQNIPYDVSALGVRSAAGEPVLEAGWININTDEMVWSKRSVTRDQPLSLPCLRGTENPLSAHIDALTSGFAQIYGLCLDPTRRAAIIELIGRFAGARRRVVLRATRTYWLVQERALSPESLRSANQRAFALELLSRSSLLNAEETRYWKVYLAELHDMEYLDVPIFDSPIGSSDVTSAHATIAGLIQGDGLVEAEQRVRSLSDQDLAWQLTLIRSAIRASAFRMTTTTVVEERQLESEMRAARMLDGPALTKLQLDQSCDEILDDIENSSIADGHGTPTWLTLSLLPDFGHAQLNMIGDGFYDGRASLVAFLYGLADRDNDQRLMDLADATLAPVVRMLNHDDPYTRFRYLRDLGLGFAGAGGMLRLFRMRTQHPAGSTIDFADLSRRLIDTVTDQLVVKDQTLDLLAGCSGMLGPLAEQFRSNPHECTAAVMTAVADRLAESQLPNGGWRSSFSSQPLTGLSHGASGISIGLLSVGIALGSDRYVESAARGFRYEAQQFDSAVRNWPDFRLQDDAQPSRSTFMTAWCHGAPGIALARSRALQLAPDHPDSGSWRSQLSVAAQTTIDAAPLPFDHLCCGNLGRAAVLRILGRTADRSDWLQASDAITHWVLDRASACGGFALQWDEPDAPHLSAPGLMTGLAGVGAHLSSIRSGTDLATMLI